MTTLKGESLAEKFLIALQERNARETVPFAGVFEGYQNLRLSTADLQQRCTSADQYLTHLKAKVGEQGQTPAQHTQSLQTDISRIRELLADKGRRGDGSAEQKRRKSFDAESGDKHERKQLEKENKTEEMSPEEDTENARLALAKAESLTQSLQTEKQALISKIMTDKLHALDEINKLTEEIAHLRTKINPLSTGQNLYANSTAFGGGKVILSAVAGNTSFESVSGSCVPDRCRHLVPAHSGSVTDVLFGGEESGGKVVTAGEDGCVKVWDPSNGALRSKLLMAGDSNTAVSVLAVAIKGDLVVAACSDRSARVWSYPPGSCRQLAHLSGHQQRISCIDFWKGGSQVVTGSHDLTMKIWEVERSTDQSSTSSLETIRVPSKVTALAAYEDALQMVLGHSDGSLRFWDARAGAWSHAVAALHSSPITSVQWSAGGTLVLTSGSGKDNTLKLTDTRTLQTVATLSHEKYSAPAGSANRASVTPDGRFVAAGSSDHLVYVWDATTSRVTAHLEAHSAPVTGCHWSLHQSSQLASVDKDGILAVWG